MNYIKISILENMLKSLQNSEVLQANIKFNKKLIVTFLRLSFDPQLCTNRAQRVFFVLG